MNNLLCSDKKDCIKAMADETRQRILRLLRVDEMSVDEITAHFTLTQPTISHHLAFLRNSNLVIPRREGRHIFYRANPARVFECCRDILAKFKISRDR